MFGKAARIQHAGVGVEHLAHRPAGPQRLPAGVQRLDRRVVQVALALRRRADADRAHQAGMVVPPGAGEFQRQLVVRIQAPPAAVVAAHERAGAGADDELVGRVVAAGPPDRALHRRQDVSFEGARPGQPDGLVPGAVRQLPRLAHISKLRRALDDPEPVHQPGSVGQIDEPFQRIAEPEAERRGKTV